jgi:hypothetical protein
MLRKLRTSLIERYGYYYGFRSDAWNKKILGPHSKLLYPPNLSSFKKSDELVIIGSGESIFSIPRKTIESFQRFDSIGINFATFNPVFKPQEGLIELTTENVNWFLHLMAETTNQRHFVNLFHARSVFPTHGQQLCLLPTISFFDVVRFRTSSITRFKRNLYFHHNIGKHLFPRPVHNGASLIMALNIAIMRGYKVVHLAGVDLNGSDYFYDRTDLFPRATEYPWNMISNLDLKSLHLKGRSKESNIHPTQSQSFASSFGEFSVDQSLPVIFKLLKSRAIEIIVHNDSSGLHKHLK